MSTSLSKLADLQRETPSDKGLPVIAQSFSRASLNGPVSLSQFARMIEHARNFGRYRCEDFRHAR